MTKKKSTSELLAASLDSIQRYEDVALPSAAGSLPSLGDVYVLEPTREYHLEWILIAHDPADRDEFLAVPADGNFLVGSADLELPEESSLGSMALRCAFATWIDVRFLKPKLKVGKAPKSDVIRARQQWIEAGEGKVIGSPLTREVDDDPEYQDWVEEVLRPARSALIEAKNHVTTLTGHSRRVRSLQIAASFIVVVFAGAHMWLWAIHGRTLEGAKRQHGEVVRKLEAERDHLTSERDQLKVRQEELVASSVASQREAGELRERIVTLGKRLAEARKASEVINPAVVILDPPGESFKGSAEVTLSPEQSYVILVLPLGESTAASRYRLEVRMKDAVTPIWVNNQLFAQEPGDVLVDTPVRLSDSIRVGIPAGVLEHGVYVVELFSDQAKSLTRVMEHELEVKME